MVFEAPSDRNRSSSPHASTDLRISRNPYVKISLVLHTQYVFAKLMPDYSL